MAENGTRTTAFNQSKLTKQKSNGPRFSPNTYNDKPSQAPSVWPPQPLLSGRPRTPEPINLNLDDEADPINLPPRERRGFVGTLTRSLSNSAKKMGLVRRPGQRVLKLRGCVVVVLLLLAALLTSGLAALVFLYGRCPLSEVLTTRPKWGHRDCKPWLMVQNNVLTLDLAGRWEMDPLHQPSQALWRVRFVNYTSDPAGFRSNMQNMTQQLQGALQGLKGRRYYEVLQSLKFSNISAGGTTGYLALEPNVDMQSIVSGRLADHAQARDLSAWMTSSSKRPRPDDEVQKMTAGRFPSACREKTVVHGRNKVQVKNGLLTSLIDQEDDFHRGRYIEFIPTEEGGATEKGSVKEVGACYEYKVPLESNAKAPGALGVPLLGDIVTYLGTPGLFMLQFDVQQVFALDWCNRERESCTKAFCTHSNHHCNGTSAPQAAATAYPLLNGTTSRFPVVYSAPLNLYGFVWAVGESGTAPSTPVSNTTAEEEDTANPPDVSPTKAKSGDSVPPATPSPTARMYLVVPELLPTTSCASCPPTPLAAPSPSPCQTFLGIELHYFQYSPSSTTAPKYQTTFEYNIHTDGGLFAEGSETIVHCNASALQFAASPDSLAKAMALPKRVDSGIFQCKLPLCAGALEKLALVFAGVTGLYVVVGTILVVACAGRKKAQVVGGVADLEDNFWQVTRK